MITRKFAITWMVVAWFASSAASANARQDEDAESAKRPNILFAFADDWGRLASAYAASEGGQGINAVVRTPNFDQVARRGVLFLNAYVNAPSCTPCRSSLLSGQYFWRTGRGAILQGAEWDESIPAWPLLLGESGYQLGKTWKVWSPGKPADAPYGRQRHAFQQAGGRFNRFSQTASELVASGKSIDQAKQVLLNEVRDNFRAMLAKKGDRPFCYWFGPTNVHRQWVRGSGRNLWGINPDDLQGRLPAFLPDVPVIREDMADYLGEIAAFDAGLGVLLDELRSHGELDNTLIVVSGDHGPPGFPHGKCNLYDFGVAVSLAIAGPKVQGGRVVEDFVSLPDLAPTFLEAAGLQPPAVMTARSLWPVLQSPQQGLVNPLRTFVVTGRERHVAIAREGQLPYPQRAIRTKDFLYIRNFHPERFPLGDLYRLDGQDPPTFTEIENNTMVTLPDEDAGPTKAWLVEHREDRKYKRYFEHAYHQRPEHQLFDLRQDPDQMHNVADNPDYRKDLRRLREQLMSILRESGDPRTQENGRFFETPPMAGRVGGGE